MVGTINIPNLDEARRGMVPEERFNCEKSLLQELLPWAKGHNHCKPQISVI